MLAERRSPTALPLCDLSMTESLRARRRLGRVPYLVALLTARRAKNVGATAQASREQVGSAAPRAARTL